MIRWREEYPVLNLALIGFDAPDAARIAEVAKRPGTAVGWQLSSLDKADALMIEGRRTLTLGDDTLNIEPADGDPVRLDVPGLQRPLAISPASSARPAEAAPFDCGSDDSIRMILRLFERRLRVQVLQFCVISLLLDRRLELSWNAFHLHDGGRLVAIVSARAGVGVLPFAEPDAIHRASWERRPLGADEVPARFICVPLAEALWAYGSRSARNPLAAAGFWASWEWKQAPAVSGRMLGDADLRIMRALMRGPATLSRLARATGLPGESVKRSLGCLYLAGAILPVRRGDRLLAPLRRLPAPREHEFEMTAQVHDVAPPAAQRLQPGR